MLNVLFYRDFKGFTGGHLSVWRYFNHVRSSPDHIPQIYFSNTTTWNENPWFHERESALKSWEVNKADIIFLDGLDWQVLNGMEEGNTRIPIINLIQHVRHADPSNERFAFLKHKAVRICVSAEVAQALKATRKTNGPLFVIPNALDSLSRPKLLSCKRRNIDILIAGMKNPALARELFYELKKTGEKESRNSSEKIEILTARVSRPIFLDKLSRAKVTIFLPHLTEGFYLPALEGMASGTLVICPDCVGNRTFCIPGYNCFRPEYTQTAILDDLRSLKKLTGEKRQAVLKHARMTASRHTLKSEREEFHKILNDIFQIW